MLLLHKLLIGLGGTAVIGGVGYGIYSSSQSNDEKNTEKPEEKIEPSQKGPLDTEELSSGGDGQQKQEQGSGGAETGVAG